MDTPGPEASNPKQDFSKFAKTNNDCHWKTKSFGVKTRLYIVYASLIFS